MTIYIENLSYRVTEEDIKTVFANYGEVKRVSLPTDPATGRIRDFAFIDMIENDQEKAAIAELDGVEFMGRRIRVNEFKPRENNRREDSRRGGSSKKFE